MILSYNYVPCTAEYIQDNDILPDYSNAFLCYNGNQEVFKIVQQDKIITLTPNQLMKLIQVEDQDATIIKKFLTNLTCYLIYNPLQQKYGVVLNFTPEEKDQLSSKLKENLWALKYYEITDPTDQSISYKDTHINLDGDNIKLVKFWGNNFYFTQNQLNQL